MSDKLVAQLEAWERQYKVHEKFFMADGKITKAEADILKSVSSKLEMLRAKIKERNAGKAGGSKGTVKGTVTEGEPIIIKQIPLGQLRWGGKFRGQLWGLTDSNGALVRSGASAQLKDIASMNSLGGRALEAIAELEKLDGLWRSHFDLVRKTTGAAETDLAKLQQALPAMRKRVKGDGDFFSDVDGYLVAMERAEGVVGEIRKAEKDFDKAARELKAAVLDLKVDEADKNYEGAQDELKQLEAEIAEAKRIFGEVLDIVVKIANEDWEGLATKAISYLGAKSIDMHYEPQLKDLKRKLEAAKQALTRLKTEALVTRIEAARAGVESATIGLENAQAELKRALDQLARKQANAANELKESSSTAVAGKLIAQRAKQLHSVAVAKATCGRYQRDSTAVSANMAKISHRYALVGSWLDSAAKAGPVFRRDTPYAKMLELSSRSNGVALDQWRNWVEHVQGECGKALEWTSVPGPKGPMGPFDQAIVLVKQGLSG